MANPKIRPRPNGNLPIVRRELPPRDVFQRNYAAVGMPVIFTDVVRAWPALERWSFEWFKQQHGDTIVPIQITDVDVPRNADEKRRAYGVQRTFTLNAYIESCVQAGDAHAYLSSFDLMKVIPSLADDVSFPHFHRYDAFTSRSAWMGMGGSKVHCDFADNLFAQLSGTKVIDLYSPNSLLSRYPDRWSWYSCFCQVDFDYFKPRTEDVAAFQELLPDFSFEISPGEMLYIPYGWWHRVQTVEPTISVNQWWMTPRMLAGRLPLIPVDYARRGLRMASRRLR